MIPKLTFQHLATRTITSLELVVFPGVRRALYHRQGPCYPRSYLRIQTSKQSENLLTKSSYLKYKNTSSGQQISARSVALIATLIARSKYNPRYGRRRA